MRKALKRNLFGTLAFVNAGIVIAMAMTGYMGFFSPVVHPMWATLTLTFPLLLAANIGLLVVWSVINIFSRTRWFWLPVGGLLVCAWPIRQYVPINVSGDVPEGAIKVLSYNVEGLDGGVDERNPKHGKEIADYLFGSDADIICLQEGGHGAVRDRLVNRLSPKYKYHHIRSKWGGSDVGDVVAVFSRFPIIRSQLIDYESAGNLSVAYWLNIDGETVVVVNNHLETNGLSLGERSEFKDIVNGNMQRQDVKNASWHLFGKVSAAASVRGPQALDVHKFITEQRDSGRSVIVCGDFNDNPLSYSVRTIGQDLTNCFVSTGFGPGWSYHKNGMFVRIDHLFCSDEWEPFKAQVDRKIGVSDHYPIFCWLNKRLKR